MLGDVSITSGYQEIFTLVAKPVSAVYICSGGAYNMNDIWLKHPDKTTTKVKGISSC